ncbi:MAG: 4Fe-4S binding protein [Thermodesulfobacteriota bacterium]|nr:4Fe-4S binding protein [Thermodesulfobacteriota bacterium]
MSKKYNENFKIPKHLEVPMGAVIPAPVKEQPAMKTGNWRTERPVIDHEKCTLCLNCFAFCPDSSWHLDDKGERMVWDPIYCKGCRICVEVCPADALRNENELDFKGGVARLDKPY